MILPEQIVFCLNSPFCFKKELAQADTAAEFGIGRQVGGGNGRCPWIVRHVKAGSVPPDEPPLCFVQIILQMAKLFSL